MIFVILNYFCLLNRNPGLGTPFCYVNNGTDYVEAYCNVAQCEGKFWNIEWSTVLTYLSPKPE